MNKIEVLAPAGSMESLYAAINKGADAVYLGGNKFSARAYASNFDNENMQKAIDYAHSYGVKIYVTINTILKENEIEEIELELNRIAKFDKISSSVNNIIELFDKNEGISDLLYRLTTC